MGAAAAEEDGWEALPSASATAATYASEVQHQLRAAAQGRPSYTHLLEQLQHRADANQQHALVPSAPPPEGGAWGRGSYHADSAGAYGAPPHGAQHGGGALGGSVLGVPSGGQADVLLLDPPTWLPDSYASHCGGCHLPFKPLLRLRHHCRLCGKVFCDACCSKRLLLPPRYNQREPQRACEMCSCLLQPLQHYLVGALSRSVQPPVHDALDAVSLRSWLNSPISGSLEDDIYKATNILRAFMAAGRLEPERQLPAGVLRGARGLALMSVLRVGAGWSATMGMGLVVSRQRDGSWSAPCAAACYGVGWGAQIGGELADILLVLRTDEALQAFCASAHVGVGGSASAALGPVGRRAQAGLQLGPAGGGAAVGYSCSRGAFVGVSIEGSLFVVRDAANLSFYGYRASARQLLVEGAVPQPPAASMLYDSLRALTLRYEPSGALVHVPQAAAPAAAEHAAAAPEAAAVATTYVAEREWTESEEEEEEEDEEREAPLHSHRQQWEQEREAPQAAGPRAAAAAAAGAGAAAAVRAIRGAAAAAAGGAAALAGAAGAALGGTAARSDGAGARTAFITGHVAPDNPRAASAAAAATPPQAAVAAPAPPAAARASAARGDEFSLPAAPTHAYDSHRQRDDESEEEGYGYDYEYEPQLVWD